MAGYIKCGFCFVAGRATWIGGTYTCGMAVCAQSWPGKLPSGRLHTSYSAVLQTKICFAVEYSFGAMCHWKETWCGRQLSAFCNGALTQFEAKAT